MLKKLLLWFIIIAWISSVASAFDFSGCEEKLFTVTAYYSPESGQIFYYKSSFQEEVILNGEWYIGASGKKVFTGMLAWPASYPFGSMIYFPWLWVGEITDRGGAIVLSGERGQSSDRIDIWMGRGEEGLIRALTFGKKTMTGYFCNSMLMKNLPKVSLQVDTIPVLKYFFDSALWIQQLEPERQDIRVRTLQKYLNKLWYLNKKYRHGEYDSHTKKALCAYQVAKKIVGKKHPDCGTFGKMTRYVMKLDVQNKGLLPDNLYAQWTFDSLLDLAKYYNGKPNDEMTKRSNDQTMSWNTKVQQWNIVAAQRISQPKIFLFYRAYDKWQQSSEIKILQKFLQAQGLYSGAVDSVYSKATMNAVYEFQKKHTLISDTDPLALRGFLGPKTRSKINELRKIISEW